MHSDTVSIRQTNIKTERACHPILDALISDDIHKIGYLVFGPYSGSLSEQLIILLLKAPMKLDHLQQWLKSNAVTAWIHFDRGRISDIISIENVFGIDDSEADLNLVTNIIQLSEDTFLNLRNCSQFILSTFKEHMCRVVDILIQSLKTCYSSLIDVLSLMSADKRRIETRLNFVAERELHLFQSLVDLGTKKQTEVHQIVQDSIHDVRVNLALILQNCLHNCSSSSHPDEFNSVQEASESLVDYHVNFQNVAEVLIDFLNSAMSTKILQASDSFRQDFTGTLVRCLFDLESTNNEVSTTMTTSQTICQIISSMYRIDLDIYSCVNIFRFYFERFRLAIYRVNNQHISKQEVAEFFLNSLSEKKITQAICRRLSEQLVLSHRLFSNVINEVGNYHNLRIASTNKTQNALKKEFAPIIALLQLRAHSLSGIAKYGKPVPDKELGRGYYGVVYSCNQWGPYKNLAIKSIVPIDNKHLKDTALEFNANISIPSHPRIIEIYGCIISSYGSSLHNQKQLLIVMERLNCDLHRMLETQTLSLAQRLSIAKDVIEGIRYIHRLGLIHRDIKLRNVLLDTNLNGKITDMGFCKPEVLMDGSLVGTPSHMAPELLTSKYDNSVDIYAFGILLWHLLANSSNLPSNYLQYNNPTSLWIAVKEGLRPDRPSNLAADNHCWNLAERCWRNEAHLRPIAGEIEEIIKEALEDLKK
ncbi:hypothetical protein GJ496_001013 [Pomphorhynchus laevis]|nr:hypothetical protein GJ496_001013 [Pomphorhynchus laevis]